MPIEKENYFEVTLLVAIDMYESCLTLRISTMQDGYIISDNSKTFSQFNNDPKYYFDLFMKKDKHYHYEIKMRENIIYKKYQEDFNINVAINEFI